MVYNQTKRKLEKCAGVIGTVLSSLTLFTLVYYMIMLILATSSVSAANSVISMASALGSIGALLLSLVGWVALVLIIPIGLVVVNLVYSIIAIKNPVLPNGMIKNRDGARMVLIIFSLLTGNVLILGLMIAVYCMRDVVRDNNVQQTQPQANSLDAKIAELKKLKEAGAISEEQYIMAINRLTAGLR